MSFRGWRSVLLVGAVVAVGGCDSDGVSGVESGGVRVPTEGVPERFWGYCTATLLVPATPMTTPAPTDWKAPEGAEVPAGTKFLIGDDIVKKSGFVFAEDGTPSRLRIDGKQGFAAEGIFQSDCATGSDLPRVLLADATLYAAQDLSGEPCVIPAGTAFRGNYLQSGGGNTPTQLVKADGIQALCGFNPAYTTSFPAVWLYPR